LIYAVKIKRNWNKMCFNQNQLYPATSPNQKSKLNKNFHFSS
jgi:hypothetical protein